MPKASNNLVQRKPLPTRLKYQRSKPILLLVLQLITIMLTYQTLQAETSPPFQLPPESELLKIKSAVILTEKGHIYLELFPADAPWHVANFKYLADRGFFRNQRFHIHEPGYVIQGGAPGPRLNSGPGYTIPPEFNQHQHKAGTLSMVRKPNQLDHDLTRRSHGSQFRILLKPAPNMDGYFTVFGHVINGLDVATQLKKGDIIKDIVVYVSTK